jgi:hypothetical protein
MAGTAMDKAEWERGGDHAATSGMIQVRTRLTGQKQADQAVLNAKNKGCES